MVAITRDAMNQVLVVNAPAPEEHQKISPKQLKRLEEQKAREAKKNAKRRAKAMQKERRAAEKEQKEIKREQRIKEELEQNRGLSAKEMEQQDRLAEQERLFAEEFLHNETNLPVRHIKKSTCDSNRLGGTHMC